MSTYLFKKQDNVFPKNELLTIQRNSKKTFYF